MNSWRLINFFYEQKIIDCFFPSFSKKRYELRNKWIDSPIDWKEFLLMNIYLQYENNSQTILGLSLSNKIDYLDLKRIISKGAKIAIQNNAHFKRNKTI